MPRKLTNEEVNTELQNHGLTWVSGLYVGARDRLTCEDKEGYKYEVAINEVKSGASPRRFSKRNPHTIHNIKNMLSKEAPHLTLLSDTFKKDEGKLRIFCGTCESECERSWKMLREETECSNCIKIRYSKSKTRTLTSIKEELHELNSNLEILSDTYKRSKSNLKVRCAKDGHVWRPSWNKLKQKPRCPKCSFEDIRGGYNLTTANRNKEEWLNIQAIVYVIQCSGHLESFYKIGITTKTVEERFGTKQLMPYKMKVIKEIKTNLYNAVIIEQDMHHVHENLKYKPSISFYGTTECFYDLKLADIAKMLD